MAARRRARPPSQSAPAEPEAEEVPAQVRAPNRVERLGPLNEWRVPPPPLPGGGGAARKHALPPHAFEFLSPDGGEGLRGKVPSARTHAHICAPTLTYACTHSRVHAPKHAHAPYLSCYSHARAQAH